MISFEQPGVVSVWVFRNEEQPEDVGKDVLKDFCGVEDYDIDFQEGAFSTELQPLESLISQLSYAQSFIQNALRAAGRMGIQEGFGVTVQYDFAYDPAKVAKTIAYDPVFIGCFYWHQ